MKEYESLQELLEDQQKLRAGTPEPQLESIQNNETVQDFMDLMRRHGLEHEVQHLDDLLSSLDGIEDTFTDMRSKIVELQNEVDQLSSDTPLTTQFKKEMNARSINMWQRMDDLSTRVLEAKRSIVDAAKEGIRNFYEKGKSALHHACAKMFDIGINVLQSNLELYQDQRDNHQDILDRIDELSDSTQVARHQRSNLFRVMFGREPEAGLDPKDGVLLTLVRKITQQSLETAQKNVEKAESRIQKLEQHRDRHLQAADRKPAFADMLKDAKSRSEKSKENNFERGKPRGPSGPSLQ